MTASSAFSLETTTEILISDVDEIPNLKKVNFLNIKEKIIMFQQDMFYYKFNLKLPNLLWKGTKGCRKKYFKNPQWLRDIKSKRYSIFRADINGQAKI